MTGIFIATLSLIQPLKPPHLQLYGQLDTRLTDKLTLTSGLRFEHRAADYINSYQVKTAPKEEYVRWEAGINLSNV